MWKWLFVPIVIVEELFDSLTVEDELDLHWALFGLTWAIVIALC